MILDDSIFHTNVKCNAACKSGNSSCRNTSTLFSDTTNAAGPPKDNALGYLDIASGLSSGKPPWENDTTQDSRNISHVNNSNIYGENCTTHVNYDNSVASNFSCKYSKQPFSIENYTEFSTDCLQIEQKNFCNVSLLKETSAKFHKKSCCNSTNQHTCQINLTEAKITGTFVLYGCILMFSRTEKRTIRKINSSS